MVSAQNPRPKQQYHILNAPIKKAAPEGAAFYRYRSAGLHAKRFANFLKRRSQHLRIVLRGFETFGQKTFLDSTKIGFFQYFCGALKVETLNGEQFSQRIAGTSCRICCCFCRFA